MSIEPKTVLTAVLSDLKTLLYDQMDQRTSACIFGSAAVENWVPGRSDIDLLIIVPEDQLALLGDRIRTWKGSPSNPILDGFALFFKNNVPMVKRLEEFHLPPSPAVNEIQLIDLWNIKNRSRDIFGGNSIKVLFPEISNDALRSWAVRELEKSFGTLKSSEVPKIDVVLSALIWSVSWTARMLMLSQGKICDSKYEALQWLAAEYSEISDVVNLLLAEFSKSDQELIKITSEQSLFLRKFCLDLMRKVAQHRQ